MIPPECRRLAEVDFPLSAVSRQAVREKSIRHGHPSTLHLWWARRPLAACRSMLLALLWPDPCDENCPEAFKLKARVLLPPLAGVIGPDDEDLRNSLLRFIENFANWDLASDPGYLDVARELVKEAHGDESPFLVDPFAGGGAIPLEALRVGCDAFASDLNPVACLILKVLLEDTPRNGLELAEEVRRAGEQIRQEVSEELGDLYPDDPDGSMPIAYLWARAIRCEAPNCGAEIPLITSFWLCRKSNRRWALRYEVQRDQRFGPNISLEVFEPESAAEVPSGTVTRAKATCPCCGSVLAPERVHAQLESQRGGADVMFDEQGVRTGGAMLLAVVRLRPGEQGRHYRVATDSDYAIVRIAQERLQEIPAQEDNDLSTIPDEPTPEGGGSGAGRAFSVQMYGMMVFGDLYTARQKLAMTRLTAATRETEVGAVKEALSLALTRSANAMNSLCRWHLTGEKHEGVYARQALPIVWDFSEANPFSDATGGYSGAVEWVARVIEAWPGSNPGQVQLADAADYPLPDDTCSVWFTDPPYYDAVPYADLSDLFFVWLKRALPEHPLLRDPFDSSNTLTPKSREAVQNERSTDIDGNPKDKAFYERSMAKAFSEGRRILKDDGIGCVVFAHKTTEGWEALLSGLVQGGWTISGSWPIDTEMGTRLRARDSAALATSVHLICRPRPEDAPVGDWSDVLRELPLRVGAWMERLQEEGIRGADLVFACIGPSLEVYSRYSHVETAGGDEVTLAAFLEKVWEVVGRIALEQILGTAEAQARNGTAAALEEDARLTALFLWTLQTTDGGSEEEQGAQESDEEVPAAMPTGFSLIFDVARRFAQPLGIELADWEGRIIKTEKGVVRLLPISQRARQLFGEDGADMVAESLEEYGTGDYQLTLFPGAGESPELRTRRRGRRRAVIDEGETGAALEATTLDRVHAAMLLQASGRSVALRNMLGAEQERGPDFLRLANALSALYPTGTEEKRLLDAMLLAVPR